MPGSVPVTYVLTGRNGEARAFTLLRCERGHLGTILKLQDRVVRALPDRALFVPDTRDELAESLELDYCLGAFSEGKLAMVSVMIANRPTERNLGHALGFSGERLRETVTYSSTYVSPEYRGYGLQRLSLSCKDAHARRLNAREALATVSPENTHSLNNLLSGGFEIRARRKLYGGLDRFVLGKTLGRG